MRIEDEIREIIEELSRKKSFEDIDREKLSGYFSGVQLDYNNDESSFNFHLSEIRRKQKQGIVPKYETAGFTWKYRYLFAPTMAAAAIILGVVTFNIFSGEKTAGIKKQYFATAVDFSGDVRFNRGAGELLLSKDGRFTEGDSLVTGDKSYSDISLDRDVTFRLSENSKLFLDKISKTGGKRKFVIRLARGEVLLNVKKLQSGDEISISSPSSIASVRGTVFGVRVDDRSNSVIEVYEGKVKVRNTLPPGTEKLDPGTISELESYLENKAVVIGSGSSCSVKSPEKKLKSMDAAAFKQHIEALSSPLVEDGKTYEFKTSGSMISFIKKHEGEAKSESIKNGIARNSTEKKEKLKVIKHAGGISHWKKNNRAAYLLYSPGTGLFISINRNGRIDATDLKQVKWSISIPGNIESRPVVDGKQLFVSTSSNILGSIDLQHGKILWFSKIDGEIQKNVRIVTDTTGIYAATSKGKLYRFTRGGKKIWVQEFEDSMDTSPVLGKHMVLVSVKGGRLYGIDIIKGVKIIKKKFESKIVSMVIHKANIYAISDRGNLISYNFLLDEFLWSRNFNSDVLSEMLIDGRDIYIFTTGGTIYKIDNSGRSLWKSDIGNRIARDAIADRDFIYLAADKTFFVINKKSGEVKWSVVVPPVVSGNIAASREKVLFITDKKGLTELKK